MHIVYKQLNLSHLLHVLDPNVCCEQVSKNIKYSGSLSTVWLRFIEVAFESMIIALLN